MNIRKIIILLVLLSVCRSGLTQIIKGKILDQYSDSTISFASVYFNGTLGGTIADQHGYFEMDISRYLSMPLTISALGYYSVTLTDFSPGNMIIIHLIPKVFELREVVITASAYGEARKTNIKLFKAQFLGHTFNALRCEITNMNDVMLTYDSENETLKAFSSKPILINNKALGYNITYYLDQFEYCKKNHSLMLFGNYVFNETLTTNKKQRLKIEKRRMSAYLGSRMHFFRELWDNNLEASGFTVKDKANSKLTYYGIVAETDIIITGVCKKCLKHTDDLLICYYSKIPRNRLSMIKDYVLFDKMGYFDPLGISWTGEMARQRIADLLPYEYELKKTHR